MRLVQRRAAAVQVILWWSALAPNMAETAAAKIAAATRGFPASAQAMSSPPSARDAKNAY